MPGPSPLPIHLSQRQQGILEQIVRRQTSEQRLVRRAQILLKAHQGLNNQQIAQALGTNRETVQRWRHRWHEVEAKLTTAESETIADKDLKQWLEALLSDQPRPGAAATFSAQQVVQIIALACEDPQAAGVPGTRMDPTGISPGGNQTWHS